MKWLAVFLAAALAWPCWAGQKMTFATVDGVFYDHIQDVHIVSGGRVALILPDGGGTVKAEQLSKAFLDSWGITPEKLATAKSAAQQRAESEFNQAVEAGLFREVEGVVYDLRKSQADWHKLAGAKILAVTPDGALAELSPGQRDPTIIAIRHLPPVYADGDTITVFAKATGPMSVTSRSGERTIRGYDAGRACARKDIPAAMLKDGLAFTATAEAPKARSHPFDSLPNHHRLHAIGSGFFVTRDGYLVTNHHVVDGADKIEVHYQGQVFRAKIAADDLTNDLAVLKVDGGNFEPLSISQKDTASLGQEVFTIGFPNIQLQGVEPKYTDGKISSLAGMEDDPREYQISVPVQPGNSGGPLCDTHGEVVGIVVARLNDMTMLEASGVVPQNVNYAVKSRLAAKLLHSVKGLTLAPSLVPLSGDPVKTVESGIAMLWIY
ncbi:MAG TPA: serine protease [Verrucomicrobiae bacterium]|jgi:S1-C subfamily serine protease